MVDHKHDKSGKVRGLLCIRYNSGIGHFLEDESILVAAIAYLRLDGNYDAALHRLTFDFRIELKGTTPSIIHLLPSVKPACGQ